MSSVRDEVESRREDAPERAHPVFAGPLEPAKGKLPRVVAELLVHAVPDRAKVVRRHLERVVDIGRKCWKVSQFEMKEMERKAHLVEVGCAALA